MKRIVTGIVAALSLAALEASAVNVEIAKPVGPGAKSAGCPLGQIQKICTTLQDCLNLYKAGQSLCATPVSQSARGCPPGQVMLRCSTTKDCLGKAVAVGQKLCVAAPRGRGRVSGQYPKTCWKTDPGSKVSVKVPCK